MMQFHQLGTRQWCNDAVFTNVLMMQWCNDAVFTNLEQGNDAMMQFSPTWNKAMMQWCSLHQLGWCNNPLLQFGENCNIAISYSQPWSEPVNFISPKNANIVFSRPFCGDCKCLEQSWILFDRCSKENFGKIVCLLCTYTIFYVSMIWYHINNFWAFWARAPGVAPKIKNIQNEIFKNFRDVVVNSRGNKINKLNKELFSGSFWVGKQAIKLGLADGIGDLTTIMEKKFGEKIKYIPIKPKKSFLKGILSKSFYSRDLVDTKKIINDMMAYMESRNIWGRYGF